jgi:putative oxygen-independent coproporphyrinogen III oxidase
MLFPPLSLYIHIPWCLRKCPYCDFNSYAIENNDFEVAYINALVSDLEQETSKVGGRLVQSIFIGGGTPSVFSPEGIARLLASVHKRLNVAPTAEITLEANPGTLESGRFAGYRDAGVNRLSIGIQSFNASALQKLGRIHGREEAILAVEMARQAGFTNFNLDLMFGLPKQSISEAIDDLHTAFALQPPHLSWYQLTIEPHTLFYHQPPPDLPDDDLLWEMQSAGQAALAEAGYCHYEISAYAKSEYDCQHNLNYWQFGDYLGIGAGAHGKLSELNEGIIHRYSKQPRPQRYLETAATPAVVEQSRVLSVAEVKLEFMMNALRLVKGFTSQQFTQVTGLNFPVDDLALACQQGWIIMTPILNGQWLVCPTERGLCFLNEVLDLFVP